MPHYLGHTGITARQQEAVAALLQCDTVHSPWALTGNSSRSMSRWGTEPAFQAALAEAQAKILDDCLDSLKHGMGEATEVLRATLHDPTASPSVKVKASAVLLESGFRMLHFLEMERRL